jgi:putative superfamily III holin-X
MTSVNGSADGRSTAELVQQAGEQLSRLIRDELALARAELAEKGRHAGLGVGLFGASGLVALYALGALVLAAIAGLAEAVPAWLSALIVGVALLLLAGLMTLLGRRHVRRAMPPVPKEATDGVRADLAAVRTAVRERGRP